jgi:hypothetical protein
VTARKVATFALAFGIALASTMGLAQTNKGHPRPTPHRGKPAKIADAAPEAPKPEAPAQAAARESRESNEERSDGGETKI